VESEIETLEKINGTLAQYPTELRDMGLRWLALSFDVMSMISSGLRAERISELVQAILLYMDRGAQQLLDVHED